MHARQRCRFTGAVSRDLLDVAARLALTNLLCITCVSGQPSPDLDLDSMALTTSPSRRFVVMAKDPIKRQILIRWAEDVSGKVENAIGMKLHFNKRTIRIVVRDNSGSGGIETTETFDGAKLLQRLVINDVDKASVDKLTQSFCQLLISGHIRATSATGDTVYSAQETKVDVPEWMSLGLAENLDQDTKAANVDLLLSHWEKGEAPSLKQVLEGTNLLARVAQGEAPAQIIAAAQGVLVGWMISLPDRSDYFSRIMDEVGKGKLLTRKTLGECLEEGAGDDRMDDEWDRWILKQKRIVYVPGETAPRDIRHLRGELLLYPGSFGIPISSDPGAALTFYDLIDERDGEWIPGVARSKAASLSLLALGKGKKFRETVEAYREFLKDLEDRKAESRLRKKLNEADKKLKILADEVSREEEKKK